jgi:DNA-binding NarL/FixJ family response regulator
LFDDVFALFAEMPLRLVLIEDHQALREGLELLLGREGCEVAGTAGTAAEGRRLVAELDPDVALVDIRLGADDGIELTRRLLADEAHTRVHAIAIALREGHISGRVGGGA